MWRLWLCALLLTSWFAQADDMTLVYPLPLAANDSRANFPEELLKQAINRLNSDAHRVHLSPTKLEATQERYARMLLAGQLDVFWTATTMEREALMEPVRVPIYRGLLGWRVALLHADNQELLADTQSLEDLKPLVFGAAKGWPDTPILSQQGLRVATTTTYDGLFSMLQMKRFDVFPRSILEIRAELDTFGELGIVEDPYVLIRYPYALYYFVHPERPELARQLETVLNAMLKDGSYQRLFDQHVYPQLVALNIGARRIIDLSNLSFPLLPKRQKHWFFPPLGNAPLPL